MSAFVFWHRPQPGVDWVTYEQALVDFHRHLARRGSPGFRGSAVYRISETPWLDGLPGYEDWNFVESSAALDPLNQAAVAEDMWEVHADIAAQMDIGHGALYYRVLGVADPTTMSRTAWLKRPRGIRYQAPLESIASQVAGQVSVWRKQMVLGPAPEFALLAAVPLKIDVPPGWEALYVDRALIHAAEAPNRDSSD